MTGPPPRLESALTAVRGLDPAEGGVLLAALCGEQVVAARHFGLSDVQRSAVEAAVVGADSIVLVALGSMKVASRALAVAESIERLAGDRVQILASVYLPDLADGTAWTDLSGRVGDGVVQAGRPRPAVGRRWFRMPTWRRGR
ncbi:hypothetical protein [Nocardia carnea]|uniref:hypothetical protein n=1 Tax=Nocardia carnea TaxID=37328 RepID=UPI00031E3F71|nr:hypothetical protein [Nocardia carnea]